jgi:hypothetical protein
MNWWPPQPWSVPSPLTLRVRPKSEAVKVVTWFRRPSSPRAASNAPRAWLRRRSRAGWRVAMLSCTSKPSSDTKNTCRFTPSAPRPAMSRATICSCSARLLPAGKGVASCTGGLLLLLVVG